MQAFSGIASIFDIKVQGIAIAPLILLAVAIVVFWRTGSTHGIMNLIWRIFYGKGECADQEVRKILDEEAAVQRFRFFTRIRTRSVPHTITVAKWARQRNVSLENIAAAGDYFDLDKPGLDTTKRTPNQLTIAFGKAAIIFFGLMASVSAALTAYDGGLYYFKTTGMWFTLRADIAAPIAHGEGFSIGKCQSERATIEADSGFQTAEINSLCSTLTSSKAKRMAASTVFMQRIFFAPMFIGTFFLAIDIYRTRRNMIAAREIQRCLDSYAISHHTDEKAPGAASEINVGQEEIRRETRVEGQ